jgi:hypothetical protein
LDFAIGKVMLIDASGHKAQRATACRFAAPIRLAVSIGLSATSDAG